MDTLKLISRCENSGHLFLCYSGAQMLLKKENLLGRRPKLLPQSWRNYQGVYVVSYLTSIHRIGNIFAYEHFYLCAIYEFKVYLFI